RINPAALGSPLIRLPFVRESTRNASLHPVLIPINGEAPKYSPNAIPRTWTLFNRSLLCSDSRDHVSPAKRDKLTIKPWDSTWLFSWSIRSKSRCITQSFAVLGLSSSLGFRTTRKQGKTSASLKNCLACPKSTTCSTQVFSPKNLRNGSP